MSKLDLETKTLSPTSQSNPLGRIALTLALIQLTVTCALGLLQPFIFTSSPTAYLEFGWVISLSQVVILLIALLAATLGVLAWRQPGRSRTAACLAVGAAGSTVISSIFSWAGTLLSVATPAGI